MRKSSVLLALVLGVIAALAPGQASANLDERLWEAVAAGNVNRAGMLLQFGANVESKNDSGATPLMWAAVKGDFPLVKLLIERGADVNARTTTGATALKGASVEGHLAIAKALVEAGADINAKDNEGKTAYEAARAEQQIAVAAYLNGFSRTLGRVSSPSQRSGTEGVVIRVDQPENCLRIRKGPGTGHERVGCAGLNETLVLTGTVHSGWAEVEDPVRGWVTLSQVRAEGLSPSVQAVSVQRPRRERSQDGDDGEDSSFEESESDTDFDARSSEAGVVVETQYESDGPGVILRGRGLQFGPAGIGVQFGFGGRGHRPR